ncbi:hypothetical protein Ancab_020706 [Ancistrocladus abbreviatus]
MASVTLTLNPDGNSFCDVSFSSYLNSDEKTYIQHLVESNQRENPSFPKGQENPYTRKEKADDGEIDVFSADKYFNGGMDEENKRNNKVGTRKYYSKEGHEQVCRGHLEPRIQPRTPSIRSESSWNSQSALLKAVLRNSSTRSRTKKVQGKKFFANLGCNCSCLDKKSVDIHDHTPEYSYQGRAITKAVKTSIEPADIVRMNKLGFETDKLDTGIKREGCFSSQISGSQAANRMKLLEEEEEVRKSLEVFGFHELDKRINSFSLERRLNMLAWDAIPRVEETDMKIPPTEIQKDTESDDSSDLFEIECLSCTTDPVLAREPSFAMSGCLTPTTCYAPSEASIEWSVVTASAADFSAAALSDAEDQQQQSITNHQKMLTVKRTAGNHEVQKRRPNGILRGCKNEKAVRVAGGDVYRSPAKVKFEAQRVGRSETFSSHD